VFELYGEQLDNDNRFKPNTKGKYMQESDLTNTMTETEATASQGGKYVGGTDVSKERIGTRDSYV
jgi:hypothetical protein